MALGVDATPAIAASPAAPAPFDARAELTRDLLILATGLLALIAWDALGLDLPISRLFGDAAGFALRDQWFISDVLHSALALRGLGDRAGPGGRHLAAAAVRARPGAPRARRPGPVDRSPAPS